MIAKLDSDAAVQRFLVLLATAMAIAAWGVWGRSQHARGCAARRTCQTCRSSFAPTTRTGAADRREPGHLPVGHHHAVGARTKTVRGFSFFGDSFVYVLFEDGTDLYWARSRVLEYLNQVQGRLPGHGEAGPGPDATGVGWIFQYALVDRTGKNDLAQLRALQDWFLKFELKSLPNVAEVASVGAWSSSTRSCSTRSSLASYGLSQAQVRDTLMGPQPGDRRLRPGMSGAEVRGSARAATSRPWTSSERSLTTHAAGAGAAGGCWIAQMVGARRCGVALPNSTRRRRRSAGGVGWCAPGKNAQETDRRRQALLAEPQGSLPPWASRSSPPTTAALIERAIIRNLTTKPAKSSGGGAGLRALFLASSFCAGGHHPLLLGVMTAFLVMRYQGINANIMSLGIAIAVGAMVDAAVVMIENAHKKLRFGSTRTQINGCRQGTVDVITQAAEEGRSCALFSLLIITPRSSRSSP
ncbi:efflux RND transporter permease subunit [Pseudomonas aeruginosa]